MVRTGPCRRPPDVNVPSCLDSGSRREDLEGRRRRRAWYRSLLRFELPMSHARRCPTSEHGRKRYRQDGTVIAKRRLNRGFARKEGILMDDRRCKSQTLRRGCWALLGVLLLSGLHVRLAGAAELDILWKQSKRSAYEAVVTFSPN